MGIEDKIKIIKFVGKDKENPEWHIDSLERFFECVQIQEKIKISIAYSNLEKEALEWWDYLQVKPTVFDEYKKLLREEFWGEGTQNNIQKEIEAIGWNQQEKFNTYVRRQIAQLRNLPGCNMSEQQIISIIRKGLPKEIRQLVIGKEKIQEIMKILKAIDRENETDIKETTIQLTNIVWKPERELIKKRCPHIKIEIENISINTLLDSGSQVSLVSLDFFNIINQGKTKLQMLPITGVKLVVANGKKARVESKQIDMKINISNRKYNHVMLILDGLIHDAILGSDFMEKYGGKLDYETHQATIGGQTIPFIQDNSEDLNEDLETHSIEIEKEYPVKIQKIVNKYEQVFSEVPGVIANYQHRIRLNDHNPFQMPNYPIPFQHRTAVEEQINKMIQWGVISKCSSPYNNPLVVIKKKDNTVRLCLDARRLNQYTIQDTNSPPVLQEIMTKFGNKRVFSTLDLTSSYWQMSLHPDDRQYTAFKYNGLTYQFNRVPFGLKNSGAALIRCLDQTFSENVKNIITTYVDDMIIASDSWEEHLMHLEMVLADCYNKGIKINLDKSKLGTSEVKFLGHIVSEQGIKPNPEKIQAIQEFPTPKKKRDIKAFLGLCTFYKRFYQGFADDMEPLLKLLRKDTHWKWEEIQQQHFQKVKQKFLNNVILSYPDFNRVFYLQTDSSGFGIGATLFQKNDKGEHQVLSFISRLLNKAEKNYAITEREALAIVWSFQKFRQYLIGSKIIVITDHKSLEFLNKSILHNSRLIRWSLLLQEFQYTIEYCKGPDNVVADTLSRYPLQGNEVVDHEDALYIATNNVDSTLAVQYDRDYILNVQKGDHHCQQIWNFINKIPTGNVINNPLWKYRHRYCIKKGLIHRITSGGQNSKIVVPLSMRKELIEYTHTQHGHYGADKMTGWIGQWFYWPNMYRDILSNIKKCVICAKTKILNYSNTGPLHPIIADRKNQILAIDLYGPLPLSKRKRHLLVTYDLHTKLVAAYPITQPTTAQVIQALQKIHFPKAGKPESILSDHGSPFISEAWKKWTRRLKIRHTLTSVRNPQANPCERMMKELGRLFRVYIASDHRQWVNEIDRVVNIINRAKNESTGFEPERLHFGRPPPYPYADKMPLSKERVNRRVETNEAQTRLRAMGAKRQARFPGKPTSFNVGDQVFLRVKPVSHPESYVFKKFLPIYEGPFEIVQAYGNNAYRLMQDGKIKGTYNARALRALPP